MAEVQKRPLAGGTPERRAEIGRQRRDKTRKLMLTAAARLIAARGTEGVTIEDFIKAAGVARGTFYNYFETREQLIAALWRHLGKTPLRLIQTAHAEETDPAYRLTSGLRMVLRKALNDHVWGWLLFRIAVSDALLNEELRSFPLADIEAGLQSGRFTSESAEIACDYFMGVTMMAVKAIIVGDRPPDYAEHCALLILRGLGLETSDATAVSQRSLPELGV